MNRIRPLLCLMLAFSTCASHAAGVAYKGVNLAGAEFAAGKLPGVVDKDYIYPSQAIITAYAQFGMNTIRVPFLWERLQPQLNGPFNADELKRLDTVVSLAGQQHLTVILDLHNYGSYRGKFIGEKEVPEAAFIQFWAMFAKHYQKQEHVAFGLMNEPNKQEALPWARMARNALLAIRATGARQMVLVPGTLYTGAHSWGNKAGKRSNAEALAKLRDPANNMLIEFHHYFDYNYSGTHNDCTPPNVAEASFIQVSAWLKKTKHKGFLAEFGISKQPACLAAMKAALDHIEKHSDLWSGWTYWGASEWFGTYPFNIYPLKPETYPQLMMLGNYLK
jgi:endoglucanase